MVKCGQRYSQRSLKKSILRMEKSKQNNSRLMISHGFHSHQCQVFQVEHSLWLSQMWFLFCFYCITLNTVSFLSASTGISFLTSQVINTSHTCLVWILWSEYLSALILRQKFEQFVMYIYICKDWECNLSIKRHLEVGIHCVAILKLRGI